jgi:hypothetical protein
MPESLSLKSVQSFWVSGFFAIRSVFMSPAQFVAFVELSELPRPRKMSGGWPTDLDEWTSLCWEVDSQASLPPSPSLAGAAG